jgi:NAD(P)-dependent dehydrogenase (short-subunit alcohol dehydrogenase family)
VSTKARAETPRLLTAEQREAVRGRTALVTGTSRGVGRAAALLLAQFGARVVCHARSEADARDVAALIDGIPVWGDLSSSTQRESVAAATLASTDSLDLLVHNAGVLFAGGIEEVTAVRFEEAMAVNVAAPLFLTKALLPALRRATAARIVMVSSRRGLLSDRLEQDMLIYRISKAAINALTVRLAIELAPDGIGVNAVDPGWVRTQMGGPDADRDPRDAANDVIAIGLLPPGGPSGLMFEGGTIVPW